MSYEDAQDNGHWRLKIKEETGWLRFTSNVADKMVCAER